MNHGANIYTITADKEEAAANVLPIEATHLPIGLQIAKEGDYTIALPDGTDGLSATLLDKETGAETNLLFDTYTVTLPAGTHNERFVLVLNPQQTATKVENTLNGNSEIEKYIINNQLYIRMGGVWYDAQGRMVEMK